MAKIPKVIELLAESDHSWEDAAAVAVERARKTVRHIRCVYVENFMAVVSAGEIKSYRINAKIAFDLESDEVEPQLESFVRESSLSATLESPIAE
jgi:flavin-binding protein dodecin